MATTNYEGKDCETCDTLNCNTCIQEDNWQPLSRLPYNQCVDCGDAASDWCLDCVFAGRIKEMDLPQDDDMVVTDPEFVPSVTEDELKDSAAMATYCEAIESELCGDEHNLCVVDKAQEALISDSDPNGIDQHAPGAKLDAGKDRWSLLPWNVIRGVVKIMTFGAAKYSDNGWKSVPNAKERYFSALMRHKIEMDAGIHLDPESGLPHWAHFCCNAIFLGYFYAKDGK